jgi:hypothetical protein
MYHNIIHIEFNNWITSKNSHKTSPVPNDINFNYLFYISKSQYDKFSPIKYEELLEKFKTIGFDLKYLKFNDIDDYDTIVYCSYNFQPNFQIFFSVYNKLIKNKDFNIKISYGNIINGRFYPNNMNTSAFIYFINIEHIKLSAIIQKDEIIKGKFFQKIDELYQIIDKDGLIIANETADLEHNFEQHFFERYDVKVALRKYKLSRLKNVL